ncbi:hypothetical protein HK101_002551 [Irineochytrium annulatum]|nr:hypothetical protein HK101_002551 [Irineochytrium annulatum]
MLLNVDLLRSIIQELDPRTPIGRLALYRCLQSSTLLFEIAAPALWAVATLDNTGAVSAGRRRESGGFLPDPRPEIKCRMPSELLLKLPDRNADGVDRRLTLSRWQLYLRSVRRVRINLDDGVDYIRGDTSMMDDNLHRIKFLSVVGGRNASEDCMARAKPWIPWCLERLQRDELELTVSHVEEAVLRRFLGNPAIKRLRVDSVSVRADEIVRKSPALVMLAIGQDVHMEEEALKAVASHLTIVVRMGGILSTAGVRVVMALRRNLIRIQSVWRIWEW